MLDKAFGIKRALVLGLACQSAPLQASMSVTGGLLLKARTVLVSGARDVMLSTSCGFARISTILGTPLYGHRSVGSKTEASP